MNATPRAEGWIANLADGRQEIFLRTRGMQGQADLKVRASGSTEAVNSVADLFEELTGLRVDIANRVRAPKQIAGQLALTGDDNG